MTIPSCFQIRVHYFIPDAEGSAWEEVDLNYLKQPTTLNDILIEITHQSHQEEFHADDQFDRPFRVQLYFTRGLLNEPVEAGWWFSKHWTRNEPHDSVDQKMVDLINDLHKQNPPRKYYDLAQLVEEFCRWCCDGPNPVQQIANQMDH